MNFVKSTGTESSVNGPSVTWNNNPIYQSPEASGISWYDQVNHWDPHAEGIFSISQNSTNNPVPYWANNDSNNAGIKNEWARSERQVTQNAASQVAQPSTSGITGSTAAPPALALQEQNTNRLESARTASKVATGLSTVAQGAESLFAGTPMGAAALINSMLGSATAGAINSGNQAQISSDYIQNQKQIGPASHEQSGLIKEMQSAHAGITSAGAQIGGIAGPLGAWFGSLIANAIQDNKPSDNYSDLKTGFSFDGRFNPQDTGSVGTASTSQLSGQTNMIDNVT